MSRFVHGHIKLFNALLLINIMAMWIQVVSPSSLVASHTLEQEISNYHEDEISGLFAYASVHLVALYTTFVVLLNVIAIRKRKAAVGNRVAALRIYNIALIAISLFMSTLNDNKALFVILPMALCIYPLGEIALGKLRLSTGIMGLLLLGFVFVLAYAFVPAVQTFVSDQYVSLFAMISDSAKIGSSANGSNERIAIIGTALSTLSTWGFGTGLGSSGLYAANYWGFHHFGQADMGSFLVLFGIWYVILFVSLFVHCTCGELRTTSFRRSDGILRLLVALIVVITMVYTQPFTRIDECFVLYLICVVLCMLWKITPASRRSMNNME